ncbi:MAG: DUF3135 domain-containing protein [Pseudomonadota bacterium]|nr:MAG: DUF3135 domain-containing protein [Pseudomonadota bacterium]
MTKRNPSHPPSRRIDFEQWSWLARNDPEKFEQLRTRMLESAMRGSRGTSRRRLEQLQWRIDRVRETNPNPLAACIAISDMMWETFQDLAERYQDPRPAPGPEAGNAGAKVLSIDGRLPRPDPS